MVWHWSIDTKKYEKEDPENYRIWRLEYLINYGVQRGEKISKKEVIKNWDKIKDNLDPYKKRLMEFLIWGKLYSLPNNLPLLPYRWVVFKHNNPNSKYFKWLEANHLTD